MEQIHFDRLHKEFENFLRIFHQTIELFRERLAQRRFDFEHFDHIDRIDSICGIDYDQLECYLQHYEFIKNRIDFNVQNLRLKYAEFNANREMELNLEMMLGNDQQLQSNRIDSKIFSKSKCDAIDGSDPIEMQTFHFGSVSILNDSFYDTEIDCFYTNKPYEIFSSFDSRNDDSFQNNSLVDTTPNEIIPTLNLLIENPNDRENFDDFDANLF
ncbi:ADP-ribosylation factor-like protein 13B [Sarcoptes scabiei]|nr:ADP-ribosylation factor-like protein 13B [Sarcoptes scabiei]